jgi:hypothetical protein
VRSAACVLGLAAAALAAAGSAAAAGGASIASAPLARPGVAHTLDTSTDATGEGGIGSEESLGCWKSIEYWRLPLRAADQAVIKGKATGPAYEFEIGVFPPGTTDRSLSRATAIMTKVVTGKPIRVKATSSGTYVLAIGPSCYHGEDGPFSFTVAVSHKLA